MSHTLSFFRATTWAIVTLFTLAADSNAQEILQPYLLSPHGKVDRSNMLDEYGYLASEWSGHNEVPILLLERIR